MRFGDLNVVTAALAASWGVAAAVVAAPGEPVNGIRPAEVRTHAIVGAAVVVAPGTVLDEATVVIRDGVIEAVGPGLEPPPGARVWPGEGRTVYAGLIDPAVLVEVEAPADGEGAHWNRRIHPQVTMAERPGPDDALRESLRELGFTAAAVYPAGGLLRGSGAVIALADEPEHVLAYAGRAAMAAGFDYRQGRGAPRTYPTSLMGAIAAIRQTLYDARWHAACRAVWSRDPHGHEPPPRADALAALADVIEGRQAVLFDVSDEHDALRAARIARELELDAVLLGSGLEFRRLDDVVATGLPVIVPLSYPERPDVSTLLEADDVSLREMLTWEQAPTNPRRLADAGVTFALTTHRLKKRGGFHAAVRKALDHGLSEEEALAALTTTPAAMLGLGALMGTVEAGKVANLVVVEGSIFDKKPKIRDTWINGRRYEVSRDDEIRFVGTGTLTTSTGLEATLDIDTTESKVTARLGDGRKAKAKKVTVQRDRLAFLIDGRPFEVEGWVRMTGTVTGGEVVGNGVLPDGGRFTFRVTPAAEEPDETGPAPDQDASPEAGEDTEGKGPDEPADGGGDGEKDGRDEEDEEPVELPPDRLVHPLGAYGLAEPPRPRDVLVVHATIWTCGPEGIIEDGSLLVRDGRIESVRRGNAVPPDPDLLVIDAAGRHVTPGLIDCHSHTGISGGVNEGTHAVTAEVRIRDVVNPDDVGWYRQLAGGLVAANQLHGSANPIGGQNSVVKIKWSGSADDFRIDDAPGGIKFALGENVKRRTTRYPNTRMGVEAVIRDAFTAAREYRAKHRRYEALDAEARAGEMPPRRDLQLEALAEILEGDRLVHSHSYRQDEILMLIRVADEYGFTIGTFQHVLEGYKVAEAIAAHGAGASTFSDWWAYKVEVMDAIPYNGTLMHDVGVVVSFNSDSSELARRLNTEAAKAVRYGGADPAAALEFVTLNPARQLRIDGRTGSLERGKDADFVIWSESPLSTYARCEQTWVEGARYFDLETDRELRAWAGAERRRLVEKILEAAHGDAPLLAEADDADADAEPPEPPEPAEPSDVPEPTGGGDGTRPVEGDPPYSCCWSHER